MKATLNLVSAKKSSFPDGTLTKYCLTVQSLSSESVQSENFKGCACNNFSIFYPDSASLESAWAKVSKLPAPYHCEQQVMPNNKVSLLAIHGIVT